MSQLIQMRRRIKAITTIKKIMGAMRLVSRSLHTRMHHSHNALHLYSDTLQKMFTYFQGQYDEWVSSLFFPRKDQVTKKLYVVIGAQKGLCASYNADIIYWMKKNQQELTNVHTHVIVVGKRLVDHVRKLGISFESDIPELKTQTIAFISQHIKKHIISAVPSFTEVVLIGNYSQSFFIYRMKEITLIPLKKVILLENEITEKIILDDQSPIVILDTLAETYISHMIYKMLYESLLGEYAARFIATDNALRNADRSLNRMKLHYNRLRQAKITKELTELVSAFE